MSAGSDQCSYLFNGYREKLLATGWRRLVCGSASRKTCECPGDPVHFATKLDKLLLTIKFERNR